MEESLDLQLVPASRVSQAQRAAVMNAAYADYYVPVRVTQDQLAAMDSFYDVDLSRSVMARTRWEPIGMTLLAVRGDRAWVSGVGVVPAWRRRGVARAMMKYVIEQARTAGATQVFLEVITQNTKAEKLYRSLGFQVTRELLSWQRPSNADSLPIPPEPLTSSDPLKLVTEYAVWHDQAPCWQRAPDTLHKMAGTLKGYRLDWKGSPTAYCVVGGGEGAVLLQDVGINPDAGLLMPGRLLLQALAAVYWGRTLSIMNVPADDALSRILAALGFLVTVRQSEMMLNL